MAVKTEREIEKKRTDTWSRLRDVLSTERNTAVGRWGRPCRLTSTCFSSLQYTTYNYNYCRTLNLGCP